MTGAGVNRLLVSRGCFELWWRLSDHPGKELLERLLT